MSLAPGLFADRTAMVTGAGSGIGKATAELFAHLGARVAVLDIDAHAARTTCTDITERGGTAIAIDCDVADEDAVNRSVRRIVEEWGGLDFAHNNAGAAMPSVRAVDLDRGTWQRVLDITLTGTWLCMKAELEVMLAAGSGVIVNTSSSLGEVALPQLSAYTAAKHGVVGLTKAVALEHARDGIRVNAVLPGLTRTAMGAADPVGFDALVAARQPAGRPAEAAEIADAVAWLCSPGAAFVTGHCLAVDGGYLAQ